MRVFATIMTELAAQAQDTRMVMINAIHLKTHRTASSLVVQKGAGTADRGDEGRPQLETARPGRREGPPDPDVPFGGPDLGSHRRAGLAAHDPSGGYFVGRPGLRCRLVPQRPDQIGDFSVHPVKAQPQSSKPTRSGTRSRHRCQAVGTRLSVEVMVKFIGDHRGAHGVEPICRHSADRSCHLL
jgi:hypothetical protein